MLVFCSGCIVLDPIDFPVEEPVASVLIDGPGTRIKIGEIGTFSRAATAPNDITLSVVVRDPNLNEPLVARLRVVSKLFQSSPRFLSSCDAETGDDVTVVPITGDSERPLTISVARTDLAEVGCYRLELVVSGTFKNTCAEAAQAPAVFTATTLRGDFGLAKWFVAVTDAPPGETGDLNAFASCPVDDLDNPQGNDFPSAP